MLTPSCDYGLQTSVSMVVLSTTDLPDALCTADQASLSFQA